MNDAYPLKTTHVSNELNVGFQLYGALNLSFFTLKKEKVSALTSGRNEQAGMAILLLFPMGPLERQCGFLSLMQKIKEMTAEDLSSFKQIVSKVSHSRLSTFGE